MSSGISGVFSEIDPPSLAHPTLAILKDYWNRQRGARPMPSRADIRPADMKPYVRALVLVDVLADCSDFRYRTIGTDVTELMFAGAIGKTVREAFASLGEDAVNLAVAGYSQVAQERAVMRAHGSAAWLGLPHMEFDFLHLPLSDDGQTVNMIITAATFAPARYVKKEQP